MTRGGEDVDPTDVGLAPIPDGPPPAMPVQRTVDPGPSGPPASAESAHRWSQRIREQQGWSSSLSDVERAAMRARQCPRCGAPAGQGCVVPGARHRPRRVFVHEKRLAG